MLGPVNLKQRPRPPLFSAAACALLIAIVEALFLTLFWQASVLRSWDILALLKLCTLIGLLAYVVLETLRCRLRINIKVLLAVMALAGMLAQSFGRRWIAAESQRRQAVAMRNAGAKVHHDLDTKPDDNFFLSRDGWLLPRALITALGIDFFADIEQVVLGKFLGRARLAELDFGSISCVTLRGLPFDDEAVRRIVAHDGVEYLDLSGTFITDEALRAITDKPLRGLWLDNTEVTDVGIRHLESMQTLQFVMLIKTNVTDAGARRLSAALPNCRIATAPAQVEAASADPLPD